MEHEKFLKKGKTFLPSVNHPSDELGLSEINVTRASYVFTLDFFFGRENNSSSRAARCKERYFCKKRKREKAVL